MFKRILVAVDRSRGSAAGLAKALELARDQKARLRLVHVANEIPAAARKRGGLSVAELFAAMKKHGTAFLERQAARGRRRGAATDTALYIALAEHASEFILREARNWRADLIVMGTRGRRGLGRMALGSDAEAVTRAARVPVLLTRR